MDFLQKGMEDTKKYHLVSWEMVCDSVSPLIKVGLGFRLPRKVNEAYFLGRGYGSWAMARMAY